MLLLLLLLQNVISHSHRWNLYIKRLFHLLIFAPEETRLIEGKGGIGKNKSNSVNRKIRGLTVFFISGIFHEVLMLSLFRETTGENLLFFTLQGLSVLLEVTIREKTGHRQEVSGWRRMVCFAGTWINFALTGRVFIAPFLRYFST